MARLTRRSRLPRTLPLLLSLGLLATVSEAAEPPPARQVAPAKAPAKGPAVRRQVKLSPEVQERLTRPTVARAPIKYIPLAPRDVRSRVPAKDRPRQQAAGNARRVSAAQLTEELNAVEKQLSAQGYTLRDNRPVNYHQHQPNRAVIDRQLQQIRAVAEAKPRRKPASSAELRDRVRRQAKPAGRRAAPANAGPLQFLAPQRAGPRAAANFSWTPILGEPEIAAAYFDTRASFTGRAFGADANVRGNIMIEGGALIFNERYRALRIDADFTSRPEAYEAKVIATFIGGYQRSLVDERSAKPLDTTNQQVLELSAYEFQTTLFIVGFPVDILVTASPTANLDFSASLTAQGAHGHVEGDLRLEATVEAYYDGWIGQAGAGGTVVLLDLHPDLNGVAYVTQADGPIKMIAEIDGWIRSRFLYGRVYAFLKIGWGFFSRRFEIDLMNYEGWGWNTPVFHYDAGQ